MYSTGTCYDIKGPQKCHIKKPDIKDYVLHKSKPMDTEYKLAVARGWDRADTVACMWDLSPPCSTRMP